MTEIDYTIAAIPTLYKGRQYRSRLEARWAAFFDLLGWEAEYEPYDLGKWSPDFVLRSPEPIGGDGILVEIKPITSFHQATAAKMVDAATSRGRDDYLLLVGVSPMVYDRIPTLGWFYKDAEWTEALLGWALQDDGPGIFADIFCKYSPYPDEDQGEAFSGARTFSYRKDWWGGIMPYADHTMALWAKATNIVQWQARK